MNHRACRVVDNYISMLEYSQNATVRSSVDFDSDSLVITIGKSVDYYGVFIDRTQEGNG